MVPYPIFPVFWYHICECELIQCSLLFQTSVLKMVPEELDIGGINGKKYNGEQDSQIWMPEYDSFPHFSR